MGCDETGSEVMGCCGQDDMGWDVMCHVTWCDVVWMRCDGGDGVQSGQDGYNLVRMGWDVMRSGQDGMGCVSRVVM